MSHSSARPPKTTPSGQDDDNGQYAARPAPVRALQGAGLGVLAGLAGLSPWIATGMQLPLQNLWAVLTLPEDMPLTMLPLSQYEGTTLVALLVTGGLIAGLALRWWSPEQLRTGALPFAVAGLLMVQLAATVQSFGVLDSGLGAGSLSRLYYGGLLGGVLASMAAAVLVALAVASRRKAAACLGIAAAAVPAGAWLLAWVRGTYDVGGAPSALFVLDNWFPALMIGAALAWCGAETAGRRVSWLLSLAILWVLPALFAGVSTALGTRVLRGDVAQMLDYGTEVFLHRIGSSEVWLPVLVAAGIGVLGAALRRPRADR